VPLNSLAIDKVNVDFDMEITSMTSYAYDKDDVDPLRKGQVVEKRAQLNGKISNKQDENTGQYKSQTTSRLVVNINASPLPLPVGVLTILDLYSKSIHPLPEKAPISDDAVSDQEE
jgi:hypothetical protein